MNPTLTHHMKQRKTSRYRINPTFSHYTRDWQALNEPYMLTPDWRLPAGRVQSECDIPRTYWIKSESHTLIFPPKCWIQTEFHTVTHSQIMLDMEWIPHFCTFLENPSCRVKRTFEYGSPAGKVPEWTTEWTLQQLMGSGWIPHTHILPEVYTNSTPTLRYGTNQFCR